jgi:chromosome segregation ATPase
VSAVILQIIGAIGGVSGLAAGLKMLRDWRSGQAKGDAEADTIEISNAKEIVNTFFAPLKAEARELRAELSESRVEVARYRREAEQAQTELARCRVAIERSADELRRLGAYVETLMAALRSAQIPVPPPPPHIPESPLA